MSMPVLRQGLTALLVSSLLFSSWAESTPVVDIGLRAAFNSPPYLLELLETAAEENATSYFPLLDRIADGYFQDSTTDEELYLKFTTLLEEDGHLSTPDTLSSFQFALSIHSAAPRIEAQYQFYNTAVEPFVNGAQADDCPIWIQNSGSRYCSADLKEKKGRVGGSRTLERRMFDRRLALEKSAPDAILYADITHPSFGDFHKSLSKAARGGKLSYRLRYKPANTAETRPLTVNGYGVELALKRTDYVVIDDREAEARGDEDDNQRQGEASLEAEDVTDIKPLSISELSQLGLKAASFVMSSDNPFETLIKLSQDFPKHSSAIVSHNTSAEFLQEYKENRAILLPGGFNVIWINGIQLDARQIDAFALLQQLRNERKLVNGVGSLGFSSAEAISILSHSAISESKAEEEPQRYDFTDELEGGNIIIYLNNLEKDKRYFEWPRELTSYLQRVYPGQLPSVARDLHNVIVPLDFSKVDDVLLAVEQLQNFVKRAVSIRIGLVPLANSPAAAEQAKVIYYLIDTYGIAAALSYLEESVENKQTSHPHKISFQTAIKDRRTRKERVPLDFEAISNLDQEARILGAQAYAKRLSAEGDDRFFLVNGVAVPRNEEWLSTTSSRVSLDLRIIQQGIFEETITDETWLPEVFLKKAASKRNPIIIPEEDSQLRFVSLDDFNLAQSIVHDKLPHLKNEESAPRDSWAHLIVVADIATPHGRNLLYEAVKSRSANPGLEIVLLSNSNVCPDVESLKMSGSEDADEDDDSTTRVFNALLAQADICNDEHVAAAARSFASTLGFGPQSQGLVLNGRLIGPIPPLAKLDHEDFESLIEYEQSRRLYPLHTALEGLQLSAKLTSPLDLAKLSSVIARSVNPEMTEGIFEALSTVRFNEYDQWKSDNTMIATGDPSTSLINIVASVDPASEVAQRWIPILKVLSDLGGVHLKLFLNPRENLQELPIKRFYRHVLESTPSFLQNGSVRSLSARFTGIPKDALLTAGMDVPPSWLVAPKDSVHDLDNVKLSSLRENANVEATYELEHILIEGHSRDVSNGQPPRGAQLVLGTESDPHFADTIVMANVGYFQFKANPGFWKVDLQVGRTQDIFRIDSAGTKGYAPQAGDESADIELTTFQGRTLFPRLSRKPGKETEDVLEDISAEATSPLNLVSKGLKLAEDVLSSVGLSGSRTPLSKTAHADINIFSVASGHLYERMLNIMMLSVMKHTSHTVKFWFIEQFLSPSFKSSLPHLAAEYNFQYEMVTYKWPHWLRAQKEKQREIWGYKILFLDVLFPLSLDKIIFVDADQIVRTDMYSLTTTDLEGAPYGFTPMCDSRESMEGFRFWKQGYWKTFLRGKPYHISALYVVDLRRFRQMAAGDRLRQQYHQLSADPASLSNLDQDLPNHMQHTLPIHSLDQSWLWCETWCADEQLSDARTIDLCNNPLTKEPKLDRARRQVPEWTVLDEEASAVIKKRSGDIEVGKYAEEAGETSEASAPKNFKSRNHVETTSVKDEL
ncbi:MAG: hypothetical protein M4579_003124 [Chaenotheca gracillima]|nr:MAG: hypothetical protein M4579_003124 [Chaenotheca gracillima]